jgi:diguanylate cyclase (GGDEF)-like protein/PAS domain S-box-containing protein
MKNDNNQFIDSDELRKEAEKFLQKNEIDQSKDIEKISSEKIYQILHELQVHQIELEIQNEELRRIQSELETARSYYYDLYDLAPVGYCTVSQKNLILKANLAAANLLGKTRDELIKKPLSRFILPEDQDIYYFFRRHLFETEQPQETEIRMLGSDGKPFWVLLYASIVKDEDSTQICHIMLIDITDRKQAENDIKQREHRQRVAVDIASDFLNEPLNQIDNTIDDTLAKIGEDMQADRSYIFELDEDNTMSCKYTWYNTVTVQNDNNPNNPVEIPTWMYGRLFNQKPVLIPNVKDKDVNVSKEFKKQSIKSILWVPMIVESNVIGFLGIDCIRSKKEWKDSDILTMQLIANIVATAINRARKEKEVIYYTFHDQLTGLFNRAYFEEESKRLNVERQMPISIIIADVNGLKLINDTFGHEKGDELLKKVAKIFRKIFREEDIITRWGGDEFLILLPQTEGKEAQQICDRIRKKCSKTKEFTVPVSIALGYAEKENLDEDIYECINKADEMMYKNKLVESRSVKGNVLKALLNTLRSKCHETEEHAWRLQKMSRKIGEEIGLPSAELDRLFLLVTMHDIGKTSISEEILVKSSELNEEELEIMKKHPERGYRIASATEEFSHVASAILHHHEWWDGSGYPDELKGEEIPLLSRIAAIVDAYDAMTNNRPYNDPKSHKEAVAELKRCSGSQFDPELIEVFLKLYEEDNNNS